MKQLLAVMLVMGLAATMYGAVGDLAPKAGEPNQAGGWPVWMAGNQDVKPAPAGCGTMHPDAKVITMRGNGPGVLVAVDAAKADDKFLSVLRIDADGTGKFTAEASIPFAWPSADGTGPANIGPATLTLVRDGHKVPVRVQGSVTGSKAGVASLYLFFCTCLEGPCAFGDKVRTVRFVDDTGNFRALDAMKVTLKDGAMSGMPPCDDIWLDGGEGGRFQKAGMVGQPVLVDGKWYDVSVSADETKVTAEPTKGPFGKIKIDADKWQAVLIGPDRVLSLTGGKEPLEVPAGKYAVLRAALTKSGQLVGISDGRLMNPKGGAEMFEVAADKTAEGPFGPPLTARVEVALNGRSAVFTPVITDAGGRAMGNLYAVSDPAHQPHHQFEVYGADGKVVYSAALEFS